MQALAIQFDEWFDGIKWDRRVGRYRRSDGKLISRDTVLQLTRNNIDEQRQELLKLADQYDAGGIDLIGLQRSVAQIIKRIHIQSAILGKGGVDRVTDADWLTVARELKRQYYTGIDPITGQRFGLKYLAQKLANQQLSLAQLKNSLTMFAASGKVSYFRMATAASKADGLLYGIRVLGKLDNCDDCTEYAALPPQPIEDVIPPTQRCKCRTNCGCKIVPLTLQEAISRGMQI
jgi:hypothetical protein